MDKDKWLEDYEQALAHGNGRDYAACWANMRAIERASDAIDAAEYQLEDR
jgi:hypothetical protein